MNQILNYKEFPRLATRLAKSISQEPDISIQSFFWLCLMLGTDKRELLTLKWTDIDFENRKLRISDTESGSAFFLTIFEHVLPILQEIPKRAGTNYVFARHIRGRPPINVDKVWRTICARAELQGVGLQDIRWACASYLAYSATYRRGDEILSE